MESRVVEVPQGFIISTEASIGYDGHIHDKLEKECNRALDQLEILTQRKFHSSDPAWSVPLLLSIRASPTKSTPGYAFCSMLWLFSVFSSQTHELLPECRHQRLGL
jgi:hypothetical protein